VRARAKGIRSLAPGDREQPYPRRGPKVETGQGGSYGSPYLLGDVLDPRFSPKAEACEAANILRVVLVKSPPRRADVTLLQVATELCFHPVPTPEDSATFGIRWWDGDRGHSVGEQNVGQHEVIFGIRSRMQVAVRAWIGALALVGCGASSGSEACTLEGALVPLNLDRAKALPPLVFPVSLPELGTSEPTAVVIDGTAVQVTAGAQMATLQLRFGGDFCQVSVQASSFPEAHSLSLGMTLRVAPCSVRFSAGEALRRNRSVLGSGQVQLGQSTSEINQLEMLLVTSPASSLHSSGACASRTEDESEEQVRIGRVTLWLCATCR